MPKYYDIHNHLFNKDFLAKELLYRLMKEIRKLIFDEEDDKVRGIRDKVQGIKNVITILKRYTYAIRVFSKKDSIAVYEEINKTYKGEFILTPLTFDLTYCFAPSPDRDGIIRETPVRDVFGQEMGEIFEQVEQQTRSMSRDFNTDSSDEDEALWQEYLKEKETFMMTAAELQDQHDRNIGSGNRGLIDLPDAFDGFNEQLEQIKALASDPDYKGKVFPFLAVDPRRPGIAEYARKNMGKNKPFIGLKLYCPNGYSPTDPLLFGTKGNRDGLYAFCEDNGIPVTAHNSDGGFATLSKSVDIEGMIHVNGELFDIKDRVVFNTTILQKNAIQERALTLNHPMIWEKVVEKYPNLILNLAHFGGGTQLGMALDNPGDDTLWSNRIIALVKDPRYKVYTDVSCYSDFKVIEKFSKSSVFQEIKPRVLYGSDFILLLLFENDFGNNVEQFKTLFGADFDIIAGTNPKEFLKNVL